MIQEDNDIGAVMRFCGNILFEETMHQDAADDNTSVGSELTFDFDAFCRQLDDDARNKMSHAEKVSMVTVGEKFSQGSVEVARGKRMTLLPTQNNMEERRKTIMKEVKRRQTRLTLTVNRASIKPVKKIHPLHGSLLSFNLHGSLLKKDSMDLIGQSFTSFASKDVVVRGTSGEC